MSIILTDCFDTLICRREHPYQIARRWSKSVSNLHPSIDAEELFSERMKLIKTNPIDTDGIYPIYEILFEKYKACIESKQEFISDCHVLELKCEESSAYINRCVDVFLKKKKEDGCNIYCVTDYHLSSEDMNTFLLNLGIDYIDGVFSSASYCATKHEGTLYTKVKELLNIKTALMIGDNKISDIKNAQKQGLETKYISNTFLHKSILRIKNKFDIQPKQTAYTIGKRLWQESDSYEEFSLIFYTFCSRLYHANKGKEKIVFLAREGYFLKKCFDTYQRMCVPQKERIITDYLKCSRRAIHSVQRDKCLPSFFHSISVENYFISIGFTQDEALDMAKVIGTKNPEKIIDNFASSEEANLIWNKLGDKIEKRIEENKKAFEKYVRSKVSGKELILVDVGWIGRMQQGIDILFDELSTTGYYVGIYQNLFETPFVERHGLVFNNSEDGSKSAYFHIFRSNIQFYEQLLAAPHGSACFYRFDDSGNPIVIEKWDDNERLLYKEVIENVQQKLLNDFERLCTYSFEGVNADCYEKKAYNKALALLMLRSCLIQTKKRMKFMNRLMVGFSQNFQQQTIGLTFNAKNIEEKKVFAIISPEKFVRYIAKLGVVLDRKGLGSSGLCLMKIYYWWTRLLTRI